MKRNIGSALALYPTPLAVVGAMVGGKPNWVLGGHRGRMGHDRRSISPAAPHYTNVGICESKTLSVNLVDEALLPRADYAGTVSGANVDKSSLFTWHTESSGVPIINDSPVSMDCTVVDTYKTDGFENFICRVEGVYADETLVDENGKLDYEKLKPVLFEMPTYKYLKTGDVLGRCTDFAKEINV